MNELMKKDMHYLLDETQENIGFIINGLASIISGTEESLMLMEKQEWYKKMLFTIIGKNKATLEEIKRNKDKITVYLSQAIAFLYDQNRIDHKFICGLANQINELSLKQVQNKEIIGMFANKLNEKIDSVDNFHTLIESIKTNQYRDRSEIEVLCLIFSQIDNRVVENPAKIEILKNELSTSVDMSLSKSIKEYMLDILNMDDNDKEFILFGLRDMQTETIPRIVIDVLESYIYLSGFDKKMTSKELLVKSVLEGNNIDAMIELPIVDIFSNFMDGKKESITTYAQTFNEYEQDEDFAEKDRINAEDSTISDAKEQIARFINNFTLGVIAGATYGIMNDFCDGWDKIVDEKYTKIQIVNNMKDFFNYDEYFPQYEDLIQRISEAIKNEYENMPHIKKMTELQNYKMYIMIQKCLSSLKDNINDSYRQYDALKLESDRYINMLDKSDMENFAIDFAKGLFVVPTVDLLVGGKLSKAFGIENKDAFIARFNDMLNGYRDKIFEIYEFTEEVSPKWESEINEFVQESVIDVLEDNISANDIMELMKYCIEKNQVYEQIYEN